MFKYAYIVYGMVVLVVSTVANLEHASSTSTTSSNWISHSGGGFWGGSHGSTGGFSSGGSHK